MHAENYLRIYLLKEEQISGPESDQFQTRTHIILNKLKCKWKVQLFL